MMSAKTEHMVRRWGEQRWVLDSIIQAVGMEWDQPRLGYTMYPAGPDAIADFRTVGLRVKKFADMHREFGAAGAPARDQGREFREAGPHGVGARELLHRRACSIRPRAGRSSRTTRSRSTTTRAWSPATTSSRPSCTAPVERVEVPFGGKGRSLPGYLHLPHEPKRRARNSRCVIGIDGMDGSKEIMCSMYGDKFLERGMANFIYDGPGQGECTISDLHVTEKQSHGRGARGL